jgi:rod shape-determining protein MreC
VAALGSPAQRPAAPASGLKTRPSAPVARRAFLTALIVLSLILLSVYFRESSSGPLHGLQSTGATILRPFESAAHRVAQPFQDAATWFGGVLDAKSENARLKREIEQLRALVVRHETAAQENADLKLLLGYRDGSSFPKDYRMVAASVLSRPPADFVQQLVVAAGSNAGVQVHDPVVTQDGLVGQVTRVTKETAQVTLLTDETSAASGLDIKTNASGIVEHAQTTDGSLELARVPKSQVVDRGDVIVTAGWRSGPLSDIYPRGIPIGTVTSVNQLDTDLYKRVEIQPFVDFGSLESVGVLVLKTPTVR